MPDRWVFAVGVEKPLHAALGIYAFADADALALAVGVSLSRQVILTGQHATLAAVRARLKRFKKAVKKGDTVLAAWLGPVADGRLVCWDTLPDDPAETALPAAEFVESLTASKAGRVVFLFGAGVELRGVIAAPHAALLAARPEEPIPVAAAAKAGLWPQLIAEALAGKHRAATVEGVLTAGSLQAFIEDELPRRLRRHLTPGVTQTPLLLGDAAAEIVNLSGTLSEDAGAVLDPARLRRVVFRGETTTRVKDLTDFRKGFQVPDYAGPGSKKFIRRIAEADVKADLEAVFAACREQFGYRRKDLELQTGSDGIGTLRTPDFEYNLMVDLDATDPSKVVWRREAGGFKNADAVRTPAFAAAFPSTFDSLVFEFAGKFDVSAFVDRLEDEPVPGATVNASGDGASCEVALKGFPGTVLVTKHALTVRGRAANAGGLLDVFLAFVRAFGVPGDKRIGM